MSSSSVTPCCCRALVKTIGTTVPATRAFTKTDAIRSGGTVSPPRYASISSSSASMMLSISSVWAEATSRIAASPDSLVMQSTTPERSGSGRLAHRQLDPNVAWICPINCSRSAFSASIRLMTINFGLPSASAASNSFRVLTSIPAAALTTRIAASAAGIDCNAAPMKSG